MDDQQILLDFDGTDPEQQLRRRWAENAIREREFWTPERLCLAYMQGTQPDDSDMRWWDAQPFYKRHQWLAIKDREYSQARAENRMPRPFDRVWIEWEETINREMATFERLVIRFMEEIREAFSQARGVQIDFEKFDPSYRDQAKSALREAFERVAIPEKCVGMQN